MAVYENFESERGEGFDLPGTITLNNVAYPQVWTGYTVRFEAKRAPTDPAALVSKDSGAGGVTLGGAGVYTVHIAPADTSAFTKAELLTYAVWLTDPTGTMPVVVARGTWLVAVPG